MVLTCNRLTSLPLQLLEAAERVHSKNRYRQLDQEKKQMELSHKRARFELEKVASDSARDHEVQGHILT